VDEPDEREEVVPPYEKRVYIAYTPLIATGRPVPFPGEAPNLGQRSD
jgi:hypothetical protein